MSCISIEGLVPREALESIRSKLEVQVWHHGGQTAGEWNSSRKRNRQLSEDVLVEERHVLLQCMMQAAQFDRLVIPHRGFAPRFNRYSSGDYYRAHNDNASNGEIRADLSYTIFLSDPSEYDGGELVVYGENQQTEFKLSAGSIVVYPSGLLHEVRKVTRGERYAAFGWIQSYVRSASERHILSELRDGLQQMVLAGELETPSFRCFATAEALLRQKWYFG